MTWEDMACCLCQCDRAAFWEKLARQLQRYRYCTNGDCTEDNMGRLPGENDDAMDTETFMMAGFMILPMLFVLFGLMQRMNQRRRELPPGKPSREDGHDGPPMEPLD